MDIDDAGLPEALRERLRSPGKRSLRNDGDYVLYWLHHAMRAEENPALDVAILLANHLERPLLVYQALPESIPYASDRHHRFVLEGVLDLQRAMDERGIRYAFHLERRSDRHHHLKDLVEQAAAVVTDEMPVPPMKGWIEQLARNADSPVFAVDTSCVVPMLKVGRAHDRAYQYRQATKPMYKERVSRQWQSPALENHSEFELPFEALRFSHGEIGSLLADCAIDHAIGGVPHTRGGSESGYERWQTFRDSGLSHYDKVRNNPLTQGTSRLSAYLHYGMVSPFRIAREASLENNSGAEKFLDELLIWRELAFCFCLFRDEVDTLAAIPEWARTTLKTHAKDQRSEVMSWETLARAQTGDPLWDAAQQSLLIHGELHNNVRMTWGKAFLSWTSNPKRALRWMLDLNHRYALDGRDPASYGGILWCMGQFDRPFTPEQPVLGTVRGRPTTHHAKRLDVAKYASHTSRPLFSLRPRVAIIGAGISGLACARTLQDHGLEVTVLEKSRGAGGRMSTRRTEEGLRFDHGAQYFTARDERFQRYVSSWQEDGIVERWDGRIAKVCRGSVEFKEPTTERFVGVPGMSAIGRHLAKNLTPAYQTLIQRIENVAGRWELVTADERHGEFDIVVITTPAAQAAALLAAAPEMQRTAASVKMNGCWAVMAAFDDALSLPFDGAFVDDSPLSWVARNSSKPGRAEGETWVLHASPSWSEENVDHEAAEMLPQLLEAFWDATGHPPRTPSYVVAHRWKCAIPPEPLDEGCMFDSRLGLGVCGDWCNGARVEGAFLSGMAMAGRVLEHAALG